MITEIILAIIVLVIGYFIRNTIEGEIKPSKNHMITALVIGIGLFVGSIFYSELFPISGVFFLWTGMMK